MDLSATAFRPAMGMPILHDSDRYDFVLDIGSGNFGVARLMRDRIRAELVTVKYIESGDENVRREINNLRLLRHPNIVKFKEFSTTKEVCRRDLKLENTLLDGSPAPRLKICDFGYSKSSVLHSQPKFRVGIPTDVAPEVQQKQHYDGKIADVWSCGVTLYVMKKNAYLLLKDVYDDHVKNGHKEASALRNKPFSHYEALPVLFGKDRATELGAETALDVLEAEASSKKEQLVDLTEGGSDNEETGVKQPQSSKKRSRSEDGSIATLVEKVSNFCGDYRALMEHLKDIFGYFKQEAETNERRGKFFEEIMKIFGLTPNDILDAGEYIAKDVAKVDFYLGLPLEFRKLYVLKQLDELSD